MLDNDDDVQAVFQRAFEARFKPLENSQPRTQRVTPADLNHEQQEGESDWEGISSEDGTQPVQVIEYSGPTGGGEEDKLSKQEMKTFMSSKPPASANPYVNAIQTADADSDEEAEVVNLKNDFALQRLLRESHLLDPSSGSPSIARNSRHKALNLRLASLGATKPALEQAQMPMAHRKGISAKARQRQDRLRKEAQENGIVLERAAKRKSSSEGKRERGVGASSVGSFRGGTLRLNKRDVASIQGPRRKIGGKVRPKV
ncbi:MAG: hypothetical protein M1822_002182 [Bathelium mastoideum]|nr:MAG: hypothetical protein M1822_002182 [Bathelium mastoideum]